MRPFLDSDRWWWRVWHGIDSSNHSLAITFLLEVGSTYIGNFKFWCIYILYMYNITNHCNKNPSKWSVVRIGTRASCGLLARNVKTRQKMKSSSSSGFCHWPVVRRTIHMWVSSSPRHHQPRAKCFFHDFVRHHYSQMNETRKRFMEIHT
jgi:hypothetical protein